MPLIRILSVHSNPVVQDALLATINAEADMIMAGQVPDGRTAIALFRGLKPDVTLMDLDLPDMNGAKTIRMIRAQHPRAKAVALRNYFGTHYSMGASGTDSNGSRLRATLRDDLVNAIRSVHASVSCQIDSFGFRSLEKQSTDNTLSPRQRQVLSELSKGLSNRAIGLQLHISQETVKTHISAILSKLQVEGRTQAIITGIRLGLIRLS